MLENHKLKYPILGGKKCTFLKVEWTCSRRCSAENLLLEKDVLHGNTNDTEAVYLDILLP